MNKKLARMMRYDAIILARAGGDYEERARKLAKLARTVQYIPNLAIVPFLRGYCGGNYSHHADDVRDSALRCGISF